MKKILLSAIFVAFALPSAFAIPALQIYIPGATFDHGTNTWVTGDSDFELWVITADTDTKPLYDLTLVAALATDQAPVDNALTMGGHSYMASEYQMGTPPSWGTSAGSYPGHGVYPTNYVELNIAAVVETASVPVEDYQPGEDGVGMGEIFKYQISSTYEQVHFDAYAFHYGTDGHFKFVPPSHHAEMVAEPGTMLLFGLGLAGAGIVRKFRK
jgi:hypothetical protein